MADETPSSHTASLPALLGELGVSLIATTSSGSVLVVRGERGRVTVDEHLLAGAAAIGVAPGWLALAGADEVWELVEQPAMVARPGERLDALYVPHRRLPLGGSRPCELFRGSDGATWMVDSGGSGLATIEPGVGVVPRWSSGPALAEEDRTLNGVAVSAGVARYVTAVGPVDDELARRQGRVAGGVVIEVDSGEIIAAGLGLPHSPRLHDSRLWVLESAFGVLATVDRATGRRTTVCALPGFPRGLAFVGHLAVVGLSPSPDGHDRTAGVAVVDIRSGALVALLHCGAAVPDVVDLQVLPHRSPTLLELDDDVLVTSHLLPDTPRHELAPDLRPTAASPPDHLDRSHP